MKLATVVVLALSGLATALPGYGETTTTTPKGYGETTTTTPKGYGKSTTTTLKGYGESTTTTPKGYGDTTTTKNATPKTTSKKATTTKDICSYSPTTIESTIKTTDYETKTFATNTPKVGSICKKQDQTKIFTTTLTISTSVPKTITSTYTETKVFTKPIDTTTKIPTKSTKYITTVITTSYETVVPGYSISTIKGNTEVTETFTKTSEIVKEGPGNQLSTKTELSVVEGSTCFPTTRYEGITSYSTVTKPTESVTKIVTSTKVCGPEGYGY